MKFTEKVSAKFRNDEENAKDARAIELCNKMERYWLPKLTERDQEITQIARMLEAAADELLDC